MCKNYNTIDCECHIVGRLQTFCCCLKNLSVAIFPLYSSEVGVEFLNFSTPQLFFDNSNSDQKYTRLWTWLGFHQSWSTILVGHTTDMFDIITLITIKNFFFVRLHICIHLCQGMQSVVFSVCLLYSVFKKLCQFHLQHLCFLSTDFSDSFTVTVRNYQHTYVE